MSLFADNHLKEDSFTNKDASISARLGVGAQLFSEDNGDMVELGDASVNLPQIREGGHKVITKRNAFADRVGTE